MQLDIAAVELRHASIAAPATPYGEMAAMSLPARLFERILDHIDYGIACVDGSGRLLNANRSARDAWPRMNREREPLASAIRAAATLGTRRLVDTDVADTRFTVAVIPLRESASGAAQVLLILGKPSVCEQLSSYWYGVGRGLTAAEQSVLEAITAGCSPRGIAERHRVSLATVRSQIASLREKTGTDSMYSLLREMARLPPISYTATDSAKN